MHRALSSLIVGIAVGCFPITLLAEVDVTSMISSTFSVSAANGMVSLPVSLSLTACAFGQVQDSLGGFDTGFDCGEPTMASASASTTLANWMGTANTVTNTETSTSGVNILDPIAASAGTVSGGTYGDLSGTLEVVNSSMTGPGPVTLTFSDTLTGTQNLTVTATGLLAQSEVIFNLVVNGTTELFFDSPLSIGPSMMLHNSINVPQTNMDSTLMTNTMYTFDAQVDSESSGINTPEPSFFILTALGLSGLLLARAIRRRKCPDLID